MKNHWKQRLALVLCVLLLATALTGCGEKVKVEKMLKNFESACQAGDLDKALDCVDPTVAGAARAVTKLIGGGAGAVLELLPIVFDMDFSWLGDTDGEAGKSILSSFHIKPTAFSFNDAKDKCTVLVTYSIEALGSERTMEGTIHCVNKDGSWYITF